MFVEVGDARDAARLVGAAHAHHGASLGSTGAVANIVSGIVLTYMRPFQIGDRVKIADALGDVLIVSEADRNSGSMRSVEYAKKMGKKIYTFSHRTGESEGSMDLVKQGEAEIIYDIDGFVSQYGHIKAVENDPFLAFCRKNPSYEAVFREYGEKVSQYELDGKIAVVNGQIRLI